MQTEGPPGSCDGGLSSEMTLCHPEASTSDPKGGEAQRGFGPFRLAQGDG